MFKKYFWINILLPDVYPSRRLLATWLAKGLIKTEIKFFRFWFVYIVYSIEYIALLTVIFSQIDPNEACWTHKWWKKTSNLWRKRKKKALERIRNSVSQPINLFSFYLHIPEKQLSAYFSSLYFSVFCQK